MSRIRQTKTNFTAGEVSSRLLGRGDLRAYENGGLTMKNVFIHPTGGVTRRYGTDYIDTVDGEGRLINFEFNTEQTYLLVFTALKIEVYKEDVLVATITTTYTTDQIKKLSWTQSADTLVLCHPEVEPQLVTRTSDVSWSINPIEFYTESGLVYHPEHRFVDPNVTMNPSGTSGTIALVASTSMFTPDSIGTVISLNDGQVKIISYSNPTTVSATVLNSLSSSGATYHWKENAFSNQRGWPVTAAFHQDRLVFGGSKDLPNRLWFSKTGDLYNFDEGDGLDDEAISFSILSDQVNAITALFSGRHLQVFTSGAEWMVTGSPLTPETVQVSRQTRVGSRTDLYVPPINIDGATLFSARNGKELREFLYADVEAAYKATDLALLARHIINTPVDQAFDSQNRLLFVVMEDGSVGVLTVYREEAIAAWTRIETSGEIKSVTSVNDMIYFLVDRDGDVMVEKLSEDIHLDSVLRGSSETAKTVWSGLTHLEGQTVSIVADGMVQSDKVVSSGTITLDTSAQEVVIGLAYTHIVEPLPPSTVSNTGNAKATRLIEAVFRIENTAALYLDVGSGLIDILENEQIPGQPYETFDGDKKIRSLGWHRDMSSGQWKISQSIPLPFTLLSVTTETKVND